MLNKIKASLVAATFVTISGAETTKGIIDLENWARPTAAITLLGDEKNEFVPEADGESNWDFAEGILTASTKWDSLITKEEYQDFHLYLEFQVNESKLGNNPEAAGNSGVYIQHRYEVQIQNAFGISAEEFTASYGGSIYKLKKPDQLVSKKAGEWQSYEIVFRAARFSGPEKVENARITVVHNGVLIHDDYEIPHKTGAGRKEGPEPGPIKLQGHANPVKFRNIWIQKLDL